jgi:hypothetical protein
MRTVNLFIAICALAPSTAGALPQDLERVLHQAAPGPGRTSVVRHEAGNTSTVLRARRPRAEGQGGGGQAAGGLANGDFAAGLDAWTASQSGGGASPGGVSSRQGGALLAEGDSFLVTLEQTFVVPENGRELSLAVFLEPGFDRSADFIPDAFEVSLLDEENAPVTGTWDALATSLFNLAEDGTAHAAPGVTWDGASVRIDLRAVPLATEVTLYFDLIGADADTAGGVRLDDVAIRIGPAPGDFVRGNANGDLAINITDPIFALSYLFLGGIEPGCLDAADADDDGRLNITDPIYVLNFLFLGGEPIPPPYASCGPDPTPGDSLTCHRGGCE